MGREKAIDKGKSMFVPDAAGCENIRGGWECADSLDCGCGQQPEECWDFEFLASFNFSSGLHSLDFWPSKGYGG